MRHACTCSRVTACQGERHLTKHKHINRVNVVVIVFVNSYRWKSVMMINIIPNLLFACSCSISIVYSFYYKIENKRYEIRYSFNIEDQVRGFFSTFFVYFFFYFIQAIVVADKRFSYTFCLCN